MKSLWLLLLLAGCAASAPRPRLMKTVVDPSRLAAWDAVTNTATHLVLCPKCRQENIHPAWFRDLESHELLQWTCGHCGAVWLSTVATPQIATIP